MKHRIVYEIESLNVEELNVEELEQRLELATGSLYDLAWGCKSDCADCNCNGVTCDTYTCPVYCTAVT